MKRTEFPAVEESLAQADKMLDRVLNAVDTLPKRLPEEEEVNHLMQLDQMEQKLAAIRKKIAPNG